MMPLDNAIASSCLTVSSDGRCGYLLNLTLERVESPLLLGAKVVALLDVVRVGLWSVLYQEDRVQKKAYAFEGHIVEPHHYRVQLLGSHLPLLDT